MKQFNTKNIVALFIMAIFGFVFVVLGMYSLFDAKNFMDNGEQTTASITRIYTKTYTDDDGYEKEVTKVDIRYTVNNRNYTGTIGYTSGMYIGGTTTVTYLPDNPKRFIHGIPKVPPVLFYVFFAAGDFGVVVSSVIILANKKQ